MDKITTFRKLRKSSGSTRKRKMKNELKLKKNAPVTVVSATERLLDEKFIAQAIWECLKNNDPEGVVEVIEAHLEIVNKVKAAQHAKLSRATMYNAFKGKNPTIKTLAKLVNCCA